MNAQPPHPFSEESFAGERPVERTLMSRVFDRNSHYYNTTPLLLELYTLLSKYRPLQDYGPGP